MHIADLHLDAPFAHCVPSERTVRRNEQREALCRVCEVCKNEKVDVMLIAGDLFDGDFLRSDTPAFLAECFASVPDTRIFIAPGNHDPYYARSPYKAVKFPDNVHVFTEEKLSFVDIPSLNTTVYGYAFEGKSIKTNPLDSFRVRDESRINLLVAHGELDSADAQYCKISGNDLSSSFFDYAALGHVHTPSGFLRFGKTVCAYSGCLLGRGFDECGEKGAIIGEVSCGSVSLKYLPVAGRRYEICEIKLSGKQADEGVLSEIRTRCEGFGEKTALRIVLTGTVNGEIKISSEALRAALPTPCFVELKNETVYVPDTDTIENENSLRGEFCRKIKPMLQSEDARTRQMASLAMKYGIDALTGDF